MVEENQSEEKEEPQAVSEEGSVESTPESIPQEETPTSVVEDKESPEAVSDDKLEAEAQSEGDSLVEASNTDSSAEDVLKESTSSSDKNGDDEAAKESSTATEESDVIGGSKEDPLSIKEEVVSDDKGNGAKKILDVLDQQALENVPLAAEDVSDQDLSVEESSSEKTSAGPEKMISEAMKKLDQILDGIKEEGSEVVKDIPDQPVNDEDDVDPLQK